MVPAREQQRGASMPEVVETYIRQSCLFEERLERGRGDVAEVQGLAGRGAEDEAVVLPQVPELEPFGVLRRLVGLKRLYGPPREPYAAPCRSSAR